MLNAVRFHAVAGAYNTEDEDDFDDDDIDPDSLSYEVSCMLRCPELFLIPYTSSDRNVLAGSRRARRIPPTDCDVYPLLQHSLFAKCWERDESRVG